MKMEKVFRQHGMTLMELTVVLLIMVALAGLVVPYIENTGSKAMCQTTDASMQTVKEAIMGGAGGSGYYADLMGQYPRDKAVSDGYALHYLFMRDDGLDNDGDTHNSSPSFDGVFDPDDEWRAYSPKTAIGWRGPYLTTGGVLSGANLDSSFSDAGITGKVHVDHNVTTLTQVFDAWHRPIVLQIPYFGAAYHPEYARLVSAGPGVGLEPDAAAINTPISEFDAASRSDDRVLYLKTSDPLPGGNIPCSDI